MSAQPERSSWLRAACLPLSVYLAVTLVVPALRGAYRRPAFWEHAAVVLAACGALLALFALLRWLALGLTRGGRSSRLGAGGAR